MTATELKKGDRVRYARDGYCTKTDRPVYWTRETGTVVAVWSDFIPGKGQGVVCEVRWDAGCTFPRTTGLPVADLATL